jgi:hypothetical protein
MRKIMRNVLKLCPLVLALGMLPVFAQEAAVTAVEEVAPTVDKGDVTWMIWRRSSSS